ncbi:E3 ubiquitin-protein ligase HUWE1-like [Teleopsis dalmanni]|uniref:E3 ubiquitin-protein ligase HUWE1-like n=1 Tax=Teleopsis dalmanni TaxID=139649 RepID=UPI0018CCF4AE|nr:E3 ubiquitin-protein ligase HUWE1-like [Teleopsis dalmanni]
MPSTLRNVNDDSRWHMNSIWYDPNSTSPAQHNRNATVVHQQQQIPGKPIALVLMEDEGNLLDPDSLTTILLLLFIEDSKSNLTRLHRVVRNLCYHVPTREWIINALISIIQKTNDTDINFCCKNGIRPQWLKLCVDAAFGYKSNIFVINQAKEPSSNNSTTVHHCININPQAAQIILKNCMDLLFVLAKHFPGSFLPFNRSHQNSEIKTVENNTLLNYSNCVSTADCVQNSTKNKTHSEKINQKTRNENQQILESTILEKKGDDTTLDDCPSTSKAAAVRYQRKNNVSLKKKNEKGSNYATNSNNFWEVLLSIDLSTQQRLLNIHDFPLNSYPDWKWNVNTTEFLSFNDSPFAKLLEMLPYKGICRSPQLTDMLIKLLALLSSELPREDNIDEADCTQSNINSPKKKDDNQKTNIKNMNCFRKGYTKRKNRIYSKNFSQLQLIIEVLTHQCGTTDGLDNISKLIVNFSQCSQASNAILLQYLVSAILGLANDVQYAIQNLLSEIQIYNFNNTDGTVCSYDISSQQGVMQDRFTSQNIVIAMPTNIKPSCKLQLPALRKLLSPISAQPYFLRTLKIYMQIREVFNIHNESNISNVQNKKPTLSQIICLDNLWSTLSKCLVALENSKDEYAVLVLQPSVEAFFLIHASHKKKHTESSATELTNNISVNANVNVNQIKKEEIEGDRGNGLQNLEKNDGIDTENEDNMLDLQLKLDRQKFLSFAEKHRKVLNQILRQTSTHLSDGPFAVLVDHTRILDFDVKRKFFQTELERIDEGVRREENTVSVRRVTVFEDSFRVLYRLGPEEWKNRFYVVFEDEEGQDAGGLLREWYVIISREIFNPMYALFCVSPGDRVTYMINPSSHANPNHLSYFKFVGRVIAKAIHDNKLLECYFTRSFYKHILGKQIKYTDMESQDYDFYKGLDYLMQHNISTLGYELTFSTEVQEFGVTQVRDLIPNGRNIAVTEENKFEYVQLVCQLKMSDSIRQQLDAFLEGFYDIIPKHLISIFNEQELELLISGLPDIDIEDLKANTEYHKYCSKSIQIQWFWRSLRSFDQADRAKFLQFVTGTSKVPLQGFSSLEGMNGIQKFQIHRDDRSTDRLPCAHTCFNQLDLPMYKSYEKLRNSLMKAIHECSEGFGFA